MTSNQSAHSLGPVIAIHLTGFAGYVIAIGARDLARAITVPATLAAIERPPTWQPAVLALVPMVVVAVLVATFIWRAQGWRPSLFRHVLQALDIGAAATVALGIAAYVAFAARYRPLQSYFDQFPDDAGAQLAAALYASAWLTIAFGVALAAIGFLARRFLLKAMTT